MAKLDYWDLLDDDMEDFSRPQKVSRPVGAAPKQKNFSKSRKETFRKEKQMKKKEHEKLTDEFNIE